jgi:hypothetical protein
MVLAGGPVFYLPEDGSDFFFIGSISSYHVNRVSVGGHEEQWPGLLASHSVSVFKPVIEHLKTLEEAQNQKNDNENKPDVYSNSSCETEKEKHRRV